MNTSVNAESRDRLQGRLLSYTLAATAVGLSPLAAPPAQASVVYTPVDVAFSQGTIFIDLNADGTDDFLITDKMFQGNGGILGGRRVALGGSPSASVVLQGTEAAAMQAGAEISSVRTFKNVHDPRVVMGGVRSYFGGSTGTCCLVSYGNWGHAENLYLGLKFQINGQTHYGWARVSVNLSGHVSTPHIRVVLSGYAYESNADTPILAGDTGGSAKSSVATDGRTLGQLARGRVSPRSARKAGE